MINHKSSVSSLSTSGLTDDPKLPVLLTNKSGLNDDRIFITIKGKIATDPTKPTVLQECFAKFDPTTNTWTYDPVTQSTNSKDYTYSLLDLASQAQDGGYAINLVYIASDGSSSQ